MECKRLANCSLRDVPQKSIHHSLEHQFFWEMYLESFQHIEEKLLI